MGQAKKRGTLEERIAQAQTMDEKREAMYKLVEEDFTSHPSIVPEKEKTRESEAIDALKMYGSLPILKDLFSTHP